jgi:hypothetical protein
MIDLHDGDGGLDRSSKVWTKEGDAECLGDVGGGVTVRIPVVHGTAALGALRMMMSSRTGAAMDTQDMNRRTLVQSSHDRFRPMCRDVK